MINITSLRRTCVVMPSQWEGLTDDGKEILIHYKRTILTVSYMHPAHTSPKFRIEEVFRSTLVVDDFVDGELYDDDFVEFPTVRSVLITANAISLPDNVNIPDDF